MKMTFFIVALFMLSGPACKKEKSGNMPAEREARVNFELEGEAASEVDNPQRPEDCSMYSFGGVAGNYFVTNSVFRLGNNETMEITLGTALSAHYKLTEEEFAEMISPGEKIFGSLGAFSSYPQLKPGRVEISYTDKHSKRWASTHIIEKNTRYGIEAVVNVDQKKSEFVVEEITRTGTSSDVFTYRLKGRFDCFLYEVNGNAKKKLKGDFTGLFSTAE